jgi:four helix bundle protein
MYYDECLKNYEARMTNVKPGKAARPFDLEERTARFGEAVIHFCKTIPLTPITQSLVGQLVRASTSIGANYCEADDAGSKKEFRYRISVCKRESRETKHWLRMIAATIPEFAQETRIHWRECKELHLIFAAMIRSKKPR